ncbi:STAS domain-containing protein [Terribacillus saccharophilus]|uniref:STAS domain-containing protein n=1 Tax=Terribacillus saccharophilus TaxID=361277 RepID=UPI00381B32E3
MVLSTPVISLTSDVALLPIVGDIDTNRAKYIMDNVLERCSKLGVDYLFIDMLDVVIIDKMVAHRIFNIVNSLKLLGIEAILCQN